MKKLTKRGVIFFLISVNCLAIWDILNRSEEALRLEYSLVSVSLLLAFSYITQQKGK